MTPRDYPFVSTFPHGGQFSYQLLNGEPTVRSISFYTPVTFVLVSPLFVRDQKLPIWLKHGADVKDLLDRIPRVISEIRVGGKFSLICSRGTAPAITKVLSNTHRLRQEPLRVDLIRYEIPVTKWNLISVLSCGQSMSIEVRYSATKAADRFYGVSRILSITKMSTVRDIAGKLAQLEKTYSSPEWNPDVFLFVCEKPKIQQKVEIDANLFEALKVFAVKLTVPKQRVCLGLMPTDPLVLGKIQEKTMRRSSSGFFHLKEGEVFVGTSLAPDK
jgi:hypothetical protein